MKKEHDFVEMPVQRVRDNQISAVESDALAVEEPLEIHGIERKANRFIVVPYDIPRRCTATYFPETNVLVPIDSTADRSNTPVSKFVRITVAPHKSKTGEEKIAGKLITIMLTGLGEYQQKRTRNIEI